jgi:hypothetical protein
MYPPEYFNGSGAPAHTEEVALALYDSELMKAKAKNPDYILIASQPRRMSQVEHTITKNPGIVLWLHVDQDTLISRAMERFKNDPAGLDLAMKRFHNDRLDQYDVIHAMAISNVMHVMHQEVMMEHIKRTDGNLLEALGA